MLRLRLSLNRSNRSRLFFFFNDTATTEIYTLSLHDALPISLWRLDPARRDRHMASLEQLTQPLPQRSLDPAELEWQLELRIEVAVVHAADLDREPPAEDLPFGRTETRHAPRHRL